MAVFFQTLYIRMKFAFCAPAWAIHGPSLALAARNVQGAGFQGRILLLRGDAKRLPFADASFGAVVSNSLVHHLPDPLAALAEMARVVRGGGWLFVRDLLRSLGQSAPAAAC